MRSPFSLPALWIFLLSLTTSAAAQECLQYDQYMYWVSDVSLGRAVYGSATVGDITYIASGGSGLAIVDISRPSMPTLLGSVETPGYARDVAIAGAYAFVADGNSGLVVIDISDPTNPVLAKHLDTMGYARDIELTPTHAFVAEGFAGVRVIDISDPLNPFVAHDVATSGETVDVELAGDRAYVAARLGGFRVLDISDPTNVPVMVRVYLDDYVQDVAVAGQHVFVAAGSAGMQVFDVSVPDAPLFLGGIQTGRDAVAVTSIGSIAYLLDKGSLNSIDCSDPAHPALMGSAGRGGDFGAKVSVSGSHVLSTYSGLNVYSVGNSMSVSPRKVLETATDVEFVGNLGYVVDLFNGFRIVDVAADGSLSVVGSLPVKGESIAVWDGFAYVGYGEEPVSVIDVTEAGEPVVVGSVELQYTSRIAAFAGPYALATDYGPVQVLDVSDPLDIQVVGEWEVGEWPDDLVVRDNLAFLGQGNKLCVYDISDPVAPTLLGECEVPRSVDRIAVSGSLAFALYRPGMAMIDISDPTNPILVAKVPVDYWAYRLAVAGRIVYVSDVYCGLHVYDVEDPSHPVSIGGTNQFHVGYDVNLVNGWVYVADGRDGLWVLPQQCGPAPLPIAIDIKPDSDINPLQCRQPLHGVVPVAVLTTDGFDAAELDPESVRFGPDAAEPVRRPGGGRNEITGLGRDRRSPVGRIAIETDVDGDGDLDLLFHFRLADIGIECGMTQLTLTGMTRDGQAVEGTDFIRTNPRPDRETDQARGPEPTITPNPFNPMTEIRFALTETQPVQVAVYDLQGRRVALLVDETLNAGSHAATWLGRDGAGRSVASGVYLARVRIGEETFTRRMLLMK